VDDTRSVLRRLLVVWLVLSVIAVLAIVFLLGPHMPPGNVSAEASDQTTTNIVVAAIMAPIALGVWIVFAYALRTFRQRGEAIEDGPPVTGHGRLQASWVAGTTIIVLFLAFYGSYALLGTAHGAGGGQGPSPLSKPSGKALEVQVIGQQWNWTFRYPSFGGFESLQLAIPENQPVELHVTSLDVIHSFWAYQLGVKVDAVPGADNVAYVTAHHAESFDIRCAEVCGLWHGHMYATGVVLSPAAFAAWVQRARSANAPATPGLPPYAHVYFPDPQRLAG
jgi:cytochrome c oxidase subunit 2